MYTRTLRMNFLRDWILANSLAELIGLGGVAALGYALVAYVGEPQGAMIFVVSSVFVVLGALEGGAVGFGQSWALAKNGISIEGWSRATIVGAVVAWALGMAPSTIMSFIQSGTNETSPVELHLWQHLVFASVLGVIAGPVLAYFQWRVLRRYIKIGALWWLPANSAAWSLGMPIIFLGVHFVVTSSNWILSVALAAATLLLAGAVVGAVHGIVLRRLMNRGSSKSAAKKSGSIDE